ncbi:MAG: transcriptional regulator [Candidatus Puniceispirillum sp. TMED52]|nr:transcriptional regulator [SAR116 cluster bacterium]OUU52467.1 MAG: transcriptional regulator [Candidatus Puniceispirillum sp. TMED52]
MVVKKGSKDNAINGKSIKGADANYGVTNNNAVDVHVGKRIRLRRTLLGYSQEQLAHGLSITFQQVQKYERGSNRVSASRLWDISQLLDVDISYFFEDMSSSTKSNSPRQIAFSDTKIETNGQNKDPMARRETLELVRTYYSVEDAHTRKRIAEIVKVIAQTVTK